MYVCAHVHVCVCMNLTNKITFSKVLDISWEFLVWSNKKQKQTTKPPPHTHTRKEEEVGSMFHEGKYFCWFCLLYPLCMGHSRYVVNIYAEWTNENYSWMLKKIKRSSVKIKNKTKLSRNFYCCCSVSQLFLTLCDPIDCSTAGFPVLDHLLELLKLMSISW